MTDRAFQNADGEMLIVPQEGTLSLVTAMGLLEVPPLHVAVIPRGQRFRVELPDGPARGYVCENYGALLRLPHLGPIGANGLAKSARLRLAERRLRRRRCAVRGGAEFQGRLWTMTLDHSPFDVVAWHSNLAPYDLTRFSAINTVDDACWADFRKAG